ncbi:circularly permuted type 2 ATP-grasp protein [Hallerella porci]|uniref:Circularly permuted ATP-grasp superfamily protein n=1 Tax=Hallerella porci TaxID=1945871 RepID=A0ABX5LMX4_9BACT|nr:circularly permuted type 2 ATP-grasp protein [Hallerella porci]PWL03302.1 putative circularly permuted ATP-grasp superfamily protein [Hallerella porci]
MTTANIKELTDSRDTVNKWMERFGVRFGVYKHGVFNEQLFPFDSVPRIISKSDWEYLEVGLKQRVTALNLFLWDIYHEKKIVKDGVIPEEFVYSSKGYMPECEGISPCEKVYAHIAGIDLVEGKDNKWYVLEDNLRIPSGASYPMIARNITRKVSPGTFATNAVADNRDYTDMLRDMMSEMCEGKGIAVILTPGRYNSAFFEHSYFAEKTGATLAYPGDLFVEDDKVYYAGMFKDKTRVGCIYRRVSDEYMDPMTFESSSLLGVPNVMQAYKAGNVALINAIGNGVADDKGIYYFVPKMVDYYLHEKSILQNAPTYLPYFKEDYDYVLNNLQKLVIKDVCEAGGYGVLFGSELSPEKLAEMKDLIVKFPRRWIAQEVIDFKDLELLEDDKLVWRKADLRAFVVTGKETKVWKSGLTRFSRNPDSFVVNSSQGGGFKDTWIMTE